jgi:hypothetical protein
MEPGPAVDAEAGWEVELSPVNADLNSANSSSVGFCEFLLSQKSQYKIIE